MSLAGQDITADKVSALDLTVSLKRNAVGVMIRRSTKPDLNYWVFLKIFVLDLWLAVFGLIAMISVSFLVVNIISQDEMHLKVC